MTTTHRWLGIGLIVASLSAVVLAQAPALDVKMGLWEITSTTNIGGEMPGVDTSKMTPEQKARMEAAMRGAMGQHQNVHKTCMTKEKFDRSNFMQNDANDKCKQTLTTNTATTLEGTMTCTGERAMTGEMRVHASSPTAFTSTVKMNTTERGRTITVDATMTGKWLGADCGDVK